MNKYRIEYCEENGIKVKEFNKYNVNNYTDFLEKKLEAINYTHCSLQLLCVDTHYFKDLTLNKKYELIDDNHLDYTIIDDNNERCRYPKRLFEISKQ